MPKPAEVAAYAERKPLLDVAARSLEELLKSILGSVADRLLVRARMVQPRVKELRSLRRKAKRNGWTVGEALDRATDLVGLRVVCNNLQDVERAADLLEHHLSGEGVRVRRQDHIAKPKGGGYRAIHLDIRLPVRIGKKRCKVGCEVQVRTLLQDAWAQLTHADIYKEKQPKSLRLNSQRLSEVLAHADNLAEDIRKEVARPRKGKRPKAGARLDRSSLAYLYYRMMGSYPPDYAIERVLLDLAGVRIRVDGVETMLRETDIKARLGAAYRENARWQPDSSDLFRWIIRVAADGRDAALEMARQAGRDDWGEVDAIGRREAQGEVPESWQQLVEEIEHASKDDDPAFDIAHWAEAFDSVVTCTCGTEIIQADSLAENLVDHYGLSGAEADKVREKIEEAILQSGVETGSLGDSSQCSGCADIAARDD